MSPKDKVYNFISEQLTRGNLKRSDHITEQFLSDNLGMSRTPIREALLQLSSEDILQRVPRKGFVLRSYTRKDVEELYSLIGLLDGKVAELTCDELTSEDYAVMKFLVDSMYSAIDNKLYTKYNELQEKFHNVYMQKCQNNLLRTELQNRKKIFIGKSYIRLDPSSIQSVLKITNNEHQKIIDLFKSHSKEELRQFLENVHWNSQNAQYDIW